MGIRSRSVGAARWEWSKCGAAERSLMVSLQHLCLCISHHAAVGHTRSVISYSMWPVRGERETQGLDWRLGSGKPSCSKELRSHVAEGLFGQFGWEGGMSVPSQSDRSKLTVPLCKAVGRYSRNQDTSTVLTLFVAKQSCTPSLGLSLLFC